MIAPEAPPTIAPKLAPTHYCERAKKQEITMKNLKIHSVLLIYLAPKLLRKKLSLFGMEF